MSSKQFGIFETPTTTEISSYPRHYNPLFSLKTSRLSFWNIIQLHSHSKREMVKFSPIFRIQLARICQQFSVSLKESYKTHFPAISDTLNTSNLTLFSKRFSTETPEENFLDIFRRSLVVQLKFSILEPNETTEKLTGFPWYVYSVKGENPLSALLVNGNAHDMKNIDRKIV